MKSAFLFVSSLTFAAMGHGQQNGLMRVMSVCKLLRKPSQYNGKIIAVRGVYFFGGHGAYLKGEGCDDVLITKGHNWPPLIWISQGREETNGRGLNYERRTRAMQEMDMAGFRARMAHGFEKEVTKITLTYTGLFETRESFDEQAGTPADGTQPEAGFGDQNGAPGQLFIDSVSDITVELK